MNDLYHVVIINIKTGKKVYMTKYPMSYIEASTHLAKIDKTWEKYQIVQLEKALYETV